MNKDKIFLEFINNNYTYDSFCFFLNKNNLKLGDTLKISTNQLKFITSNIFKIVNNSEVIHNLLSFLLFFFTYYSIYNVEQYKNYFESIKKNVNKYLKVKDDELLTEDIKILDNIIFYREISTIDAINYLKCLIDKKESYFIIKKVLSLNPMCIYSNDYNLFDYVYKKMISEDSDAYIYYLSLLKLFYTPFINNKDNNYYCENCSDKIKNEILKIFNCENENSSLKRKYNIIENNIHINAKPEVFNNNDIGIVFSIDTYGTKYRDDAISFKSIGNDWLVGLHIIDIASYCNLGDDIDLLCLNNFKKVFLDNGCLSLFNISNSNKLSLDKNNGKKVISLYMVFDKQFQLKDYCFVRDSIKINECLSFQKADYIIKNGYFSNNELCNSLQKLFILTNMLNSDTKNYYLKSNEFLCDTFESKIIVDELSILYNYLIAKTFMEEEKPFVYRIQEKPYYGNLFDEIRTGPCETDKLNQLFCFSKYSDKPLSHYGLNKECYSHCSSPLRRYPDLFNQQLMHMFYFKDKRCNIDEDFIKELIDYFNIRNEEMRLLKMESSIN